MKLDKNSKYTFIAWPYRHSFGEERFAASGRTVQQHAAWGQEAKMLEPLRKLDGLDERQRQRLAYAGQRAYVMPRHAWHSGEALTLRAGLDLLHGLHKVLHCDGDLREHFVVQRLPQCLQPIADVLAHRQ